MHITFLTQYYPPETGAPQNRLSDLARRLKTLGHHVEVLTALPNYPGNEVFPAYRHRRLCTERLDGIPVHRVWLYVPKRRTIVRRLGNYLTFALNARNYGAGFIMRGDLLLMESPPLFLAFAGVSLARRLGAKLVTNVSDVWPKALIDLGVKAPTVCWSLMHRLERWLYENSALITAQTEGIRHDIASRFPHKRILLFPNGIAPERYDQPIDRSFVRRRYGWSSALFVVGYTGIIAPSQAMHQVVDAAEHLRDVPHIHFAIFGDGPSRELLNDEIRRRNLTNIRCYGHLPSSEMPPLQAAFDVGLVPLARTQANCGARPSKMFELMASGCPLLLCACGEAVHLIESAPNGPLGVAVPPECPEKLAAAVLDLSKQRDRLSQMGQAAREFVFKYFNRRQIADDFEKELTRLLN